MRSIFLLPARDDGLNWIRKYIETVEPIHLNYWNPAISPQKLEREYCGYRHSFAFKRLPSNSIREIYQWWPKTEYLLIREVRLRGGKHILVIERYERRPWLERQWGAVKRMFGFS